MSTSCLILWPASAQRYQVSRFVSH